MDSFPHLLTYLLTVRCLQVWMMASSEAIGGTMKFDMQADGPGPSAAGAADGNFDVDPAAVSAVLLDVDAQGAEFGTLTTTLVEDTVALTEACKSDVIAEQLLGLAEEQFQHGMGDIQGRTGNALNAVAEVLTILYAADTQMSDTAQQAAASAAQAKADDDPYAAGETDQMVKDAPVAVR